MIPSLPSNPNHEILPTANGNFLAKLRMNQETNISFAIKPLPMPNHETNFVSLAHNLFRVALSDWQRCLHWVMVRGRKAPAVSGRWEKTGYGNNSSK